MWALSGSIIPQSFAVASVENIGPLKPRFTSSGTMPVWSICAWVMSSAFISEGIKGKSPSP